MAARLKDGHTRVFTRDGGYFTLAFDAFASVREAWMRGSAFIETTGLYGERTIIKGAEIQGLRLVTAEIFQASIDDDVEFAREQKHRQMLDGGE